jgi:hypothetical protein
MREIFAKNTEKYIGVKFRYMSHNPKHGLDCFGLLSCAFSDIEVSNIFRKGFQKSHLYHMKDLKNLYTIFNDDLFYLSRDNKYDLGDLLIIKTHFHLPHICIITDIVGDDIYITHSDSTTGYVVKNICDDKYLLSALDILCVNFSSISKQ